MTDELVAWLREQVDEDERAARAGAEGGARWSIAESGAMTSAGVWADDAPDPSVPVVYDEGYPSAKQATHIARHDPARVLAEVAAKRRIIDALERAERDTDDLLGVGCFYGLRVAVRLLASVYAGRPGWREEWAPDEEGTS